MQAIMKLSNIEFINHLGCYLKRKRYEWLLISFMVLIFGNTFSNHLHVTAPVNIFQNMLTGAIVFYNRKVIRNITIVLITLSFFLDVFRSQLTFIDLPSTHGIIYLIFFSLVSKEVYKEVLYCKVVTRELLSAVLCGFVLLCLIGTFLFYQINLHQSHSFANTGEGKDVITNLNYFSFTTLLTIGYGDITPVTLVAKRAVMLIGLAGHFYTVFITSIIIGKYLSEKKQ